MSHTHIHVARHGVLQLLDHRLHFAICVSVRRLVDEREVGLSHARQEDGRRRPVAYRDQHEDEGQEREEQDRHHVLERPA